MYHCNSCGRGFSSETAASQHAHAKKHTYVPATPRQPVVPVARPAPPPVPVPARVAPVQHKCDMCDATFASEALLRAHFKESTRHPSCTRCQESFKDLQTLSKHIASVHLSFTGRAPTSASTTPTPAARPLPTQPMQTTQAISDASATASSSSASGSSARLLHPTIRCTICNKQCFDIQQHYNYSSQHPKCDICGIGCATDADMANHKAIHYECKTCGKRFQAQEHLISHYRDSPKHPKCRSCNVGFPDTTMFQRHMTDAHPAPIQTPSPPSSEESFEEVIRPVTPGQDVTETRSLPATPIICSPPGSVTSARSIALSIKTQSDTSSVSYSSRRASEPSLPSAFMAGDGASAVPWSDYTPETPHSVEPEHFDYISDACATTQDPPPSATTTIPSALLELTDATSSTAPSESAPSTPRSRSRAPSMSAGTITPPAETPLIRMIHVPLGRPQLERTPSALSVVSEQASISEAASESRQSRSAAAAAAAVTEVPVPSSEVLSDRSRTPVSLRSTEQIWTPPVSFASCTNRRREQSPVSVASCTNRHRERSVSVSSKSASEGVPTVAPKPAPPSTVSWHCRSCMKDPCDQPTATACGHIFCHQCIIKELSTSMACPVCKKMFLLRLFVESV